MPGVRVLTLVPRVVVVLLVQQRGAGGYHGAGWCLAMPRMALTVTPLTGWAGILARRRHQNRFRNLHSCRNHILSFEEIGIEIGVVRLSLSVFKISPYVACAENSQTA